MKKRTMFWQILSKLSGEEYLDAGGKALLSYRVISAFILKECISELSEYSVEQIAAEYIVSEPEIACVPVHRDSARIDDIPEKISQLKNEDLDVDEGKVTFDVRFIVHIPKNNEYRKVIINLEAQNKFDPGYPLVSRGIYYNARMISAQHGEEFDDSNYGDIKKVYSIWICIDPKPEFQNSINRYHTIETRMLGNMELPKKDYDLMETIMVCLHTNGEEGNCGDKLVDMLSLLFDKYETSENKRSKLEEIYNIKMTKEYDEVVDKMCNISGYYTEDYYKAKAQLAEKDRILEEKDRSLKEKDKSLEEKDKIIKEKDFRFAEMMINDGETADKIGRYTGLDVDTLKQIAKSLGKPLVM
ncbi:hypothetical protein [Ruminococcus sp. HUN007]|uniref:hypothetical protein n=1 Tax=Ruminococcus sp. HUN007 TaxID=1514668 RepID=UPI00067863B8|nr:hypothetical protein [Ruminococcus sp. HUN007]